MTCAQLGLEPDGVLGQARLAPSRGSRGSSPPSLGATDATGDRHA
jgi:hypothetical protein